MIHVDSIAACGSDDYYIFMKMKVEKDSPIIKPKQFANISKFDKLLTDLNLNNWHERWFRKRVSGKLKWPLNS